MKINKVSIKNIQSIKNAFIDFDFIEDTSEGVFLIVGPTGSGKTTILDAITLGIFGVISRFNKVSSTDITQNGSVVTHGQQEASADIVYTVNGQKYHSRWEIKTKPRAGGFDQPKMELRDHNGQLIENKLSEVQKKNVEIIGLTATQFNKTILLAQGDFSAFLKASFADKADILEKITGTGIYSTLGKAIFNNNKAVEVKRKSLNDDIDRLAIMDEALLAEKKETLQKNIEKISTLNQLYQTIIDDINRRVRYAADTQRQAEEQLAFEAVSLELQQLKSNFGPTIQLFNNVQQSRSNFIKFETAHNIVIECEEIMRKVLQQRNETQGSMHKWSTQMISVLAKGSTPEQMVLELGQLRESVNNLQRHIADNNQKTKEIKKKISDNFLNINLPGKLMPVDDASWHDFSELIHKQFKQLKEEENDLKMRLEGTEITERSAEEINTAIQHWTALKPLIQQFINDNHRQDALKTTNSKVMSELSELEQKWTSSLAQLTAAKATLTDKKLIFEQNERIKSLEAHRHDLEDGQPCPLCGALEGPFRKQMPPFNNQLAEDYKSAEKNCESIEINYRAIEKAIHIARTKIEEGEKSIQQITTDMQSKQASIILLKELLGYEQPIGSNTLLIDEKMQSLQLTRGQILRALELAKQLEQLLWMSEDISRLIMNIGDHQRLNNELKNQYTLEEPIDDFYRRMTLEKNNIDKTMAVQEGKLEEINQRKHVNANELDRLKPELDRLMDENAISGFAALKGVFDGESTVRSREKDIADKENSSAGKRELINDLTQRLNAQKEMIDFEINIDDRIQRREAIDQEKLELSDQNGRIKSEIDIHLINEAKSIQKHRELASVNAEFAISNSLNALIGSADGAKFKKIAQKNTLFHLTLLANRHLANMSDRYRFEFRQEDLWSDSDQLDLKVRDLYNNSLRSCATLSGGETFIASLGLALGLSDFASRNHRIESLFIDEGFGTLDPETLEMAIGALEKIQRAGGKTICLITHVEAMKERIPYHLRVNKVADGSHTVDFDIAI